MNSFLRVLQDDVIVAGRLSRFARDAGQGHHRPAFFCQVVEVLLHIFGVVVSSEHLVLGGGAVFVRSGASGQEYRCAAHGHDQCGFHIREV